MFDVGDVITGTLENGYGVTTRGVVCKVIEDTDEDCESGEIRVELIDVDEELLKESRSTYMKVRANFDDYIGHTYTVKEEQFEYYDPKTKFVDLSSELIDFIDGM